MTAIIVTSAAEWVTYAIIGAVALVLVGRVALGGRSRLRDEISRTLTDDDAFPRALPPRPQGRGRR